MPAFDSGVLGYGASAAFTSRVRVRATAAAAGASVEVDGRSVASGELSQVLSVGGGTNAAKRVVVRVTAGDGVTVRSYSVVVVNNPVARLSDLELSGAQIRPSVFSTATKEYGAWVAHGVGSVRVTATADYASVALAVNGAAVVSGQASDAVALDVGSNLITVTATAPDGFTRSSYTVTVRRASLAQSADASLSGISVWAATSKQPDSANDVPYSGEAFALSPAVSGSVREHWLEVPEGEGGYVYLAVAADTAAPGAKQILVSGTRSIEEARAPKRDVVPGEASGPWYAPVGHSVITVEVTSLDGTASESYRLIVKRGTVDDPKGVSAAAGDGSLRVSWEQSDSPTAPDYYTLRWRKAGEAGWLNPQPLAAIGVTRSLAAGAPVVTAEDGNGPVVAAEGGYTISGLDNGTAYEVQVRALRGDVQAHRPLRWLASAWQSLTATPGKPRTVLSITPDHPTRAYGAADDLSYTVGGLAQGDAAADVVTGALSRTPGDDAGSYPISMGTVAVASAHAGKYELAAAPTVAAYVIEPRPIPAVSGVLVDTRDQDGTTGASFDTTNAAGVDVLPAELADFRAGGLQVAGSFPTAAAGAHNVAVAYSLADHGAFKAANYELLQTTATLQGRIEAAAEAQPACTPAAGGDYDRDDDGLIEICDLEQLNAIRFDSNADATPDRGTAYEYLRAFPQIISDGPGCPIGCTGYELVADLDFDTNRNGRADPGDQFWNDGAGWEPMPILGRAYTGTLEGNGHTISNL
ncbi:MAG: cadherin-like beta sandwich domain-containing protein, partial [bacterium]|nr:cadherin-like beta sandwich domain-containing protein [bacterium]